MTSSHQKVTANRLQTPTSRKRSGSVQEPEFVPAELILMDRIVELLIQKAKTGIHWPDLYDRAMGILGRLKLSTRQGLLADKRLRNAKRYAAGDDFGAAAFELRLVRTALG